LKLGNRTEFVTAQRQDDNTTAPKGQKWLGLTVETLSEDNARQYGIDFEPGAIIADIDPGSQAEDAGLSVGDIILKVGPKEIRSAGDFYKVASDMEKSTRPVSFYIKRGTANIFVAVTP
jgi:S1-C subfamily serine protease